MRHFKFYKDEFGWFIDIPDWIGYRWELQMVMGADTFLDIIAQGKNEISLILSRQPFEGSDTLHYQYQGRLDGPECGEGAWYFLNEYNGTPMNIQMWLCDVTKYIFTDFPIKIFFKNNTNKNFNI